jgi:hypothetical protein
MKQLPKRKDLVKRTILLPKEIDDWINDICAKTQESKNLVITRLLTSVKKFQKNLSEG